MKTIAVPRTPRSFISTALVLGGLFALYRYFNKGGSVRGLVREGMDLKDKVAGQVNTGYDSVKSRIDSMSSRSNTSASANEISTSNIDLDRNPSM
jgi:hypothetical protein